MFRIKITLFCNLLIDFSESQIFCSALLLLSYHRILDQSLSEEFFLSKLINKDTFV